MARKKIANCLKLLLFNKKYVLKNKGIAARSTVCLMIKERLVNTDAEYALPFKHRQIDNIKNSKAMLSNIPYIDELYMVTGFK